MAYRTLVRADSITERGERLTTFEVEFPRIILAEFNTPRVLSRNSASPRAIPVKKQLKRVMADPFIPDEFGRNQSGMNPDWNRPLTELEIAQASRYWLEGRDAAVETAVKMLIGERALGGIAKDLTGKSWARTPKSSRFDTMTQVIDALPANLADEFEVHEALGLTVEELLNVHKQYPNRLLEPYMWHTVIASGTEWDNFFALRTSTNTQREFMLSAIAMRETMGVSIPVPMKCDGSDWHLPLFDKHSGPDAEIWGASIEKSKLISIGRCARVSLLTHNGIRDPQEDIRLGKTLQSDGHMSPFEHVARPMTDDELSKGLYVSNFRGWVQARKEIPNEDNFAKVLELAR